MSIEGMWCYVSGEVGGEYIASGGVVILDSQRLYGGDSAMAYVGKYTCAGGVLKAEVESFKYNPAVNGIDVFGEDMGPTRYSIVEAILQDNGMLVGHLTRGDVSLPIVLQKLRELP